MKTERIIDDPLCEVSKEFLQREEFWKQVPGFEHYEVSTHGRLRKYITGWSASNWYREVMLGDRKGKRKRTRLHQLVMETFIGPPPVGYNINHEDGDKTNARLDNLEYVSFSENIKHAVETGLHVPHCVLSDGQVESVRALAVIMTQNAVAKILGISRSHVSNIVLGKRRSRRWEKRNGTTTINSN